MCAAPHPAGDEGDRWSIGELAERAGVTVKTVRFYSDRGLLPEGARTSGGHRRFGVDALGRLRFIRALRALDVPVPEVRRLIESGVDSGGDADGAALAEVADRRLVEVGGRLAALRWREAALRVVATGPAEERAERLLLVGALASPPSTAPLARFWRGWLPPRLPARLRSAVVEQAVPEPPDDPSPAQVLAFARLHAFVSAPCGGGALPQPAAHSTAEGYRPAVLYAGLTEAYGLAAAEMRAGRGPHAGGALDCFAAAYAGARGVRDTADFRRALAGRLTADPRIDRYWELVTEVVSPPSGPPVPVPGTLHDWLLAALRAETARGAG
ncbi:MerR family transcriptional regulator [Streptomyces lichenis]|uniref:MerR family transcriptional regulator n=1 Tax=Streptomyces lichenis TaxID=2306967 RepID=A0ABT0IE74_9ACTN|nr:MerR family transcriptional regulator [Streptomyces lichenis]MCK8679617.1 MerR family transcriptional regulator [Streptomyces lichenis]